MLGFCTVKARFQWDSKKDSENQVKHGVSFVEAQFAFADPSRVIAEDHFHSTIENRHFCFGRVGVGILTVRFTSRDDVIRIFAAVFLWGAISAAHCADKAIRRNAFQLLRPTAERVRDVHFMAFQI